MPSNSGGIYVELINYKAFIDNIDGLKEGVQSLNTELMAFGKSVDTFDKELGSAFKSLPKTASAAGEAIQKNLINVIKSIGNTDVKKVTENFGNVGAEFGSAITSISTAFSNFKISTSKLKSFEKVFESLARATSAFNAVKNIGNISGISEFVSQLPTVFEKLSSLNKYLSIIPSAMFTELGRVVIGLNVITQPLAKALAAFDQIKIHPGQIIDSLEGLIKIVQSLGKINASGGETKINFIRAYLTTILQIAPIISRLASALQPLSSLNPATFSGITDFLPGMIRFLNDFDSFAKKTGTSKGFIESLKIWAGFNTGSLKQMVNTFKALADGLSQFNKVNIISGGKDFGDIALGIQRLVLASKELQDLARLQIFSKKSVTKNVEAAFTALAKGLNAFSKIDIANASGFKDIGKFTKELAKMINSMKDLDPHQITRAFESVGRILSDRGERILEVAFGDSIAQSIATGLKRNLDVFNEVGVAIAKSFIKGFKQETEIASPSRVFMRFGTDIVKGLQNGITGIAKIGSDLATGLFDGFRKAMTGVTSRIKDLVFDQFRNLTYRMGQEFRQFARDLQQTGYHMMTAGGISGFLQSQAVQMAATFEQTMNQIRVFGNLSVAELENVQNAILKFSAVTIFDPQQSAAAFLDLQKAGLSAADALQVLTHVGNLAAAGDIDLTAATKGAIQAIQIFGLEYSEAARVADVFVQGANKSTASVQELIDGMGNVGPLAKEFGLSLEDTVAIMAQFNDAGIRGAEAGTQLRSMLTNITKPSAAVQKLFDELNVSLTDSQGNFRSMGDIIRDLSGAMHDGTRTQAENFRAINKLAGTYGQMGLAVLLAGEDIDTYVASMRQLPGAAIIAEEMMATFAGRIDSLKGSVQTLMFKALIPLMQKVLAPLFDQLVTFVNLMSSLPSELLAVGAGFILLGTALFTLTGVGLFLMGSVLMPIGLALTGLSGILTVLGALLFNPIGLIAGFLALGGAIGLLVTLFASVTAFIGAMVLLANSFAKALKQSSSAATGFDYFKRTVKDLFKNIGALAKEVGILVGNFLDLIFTSTSSQDQADAFGSALRRLGGLVSGMSTRVKELSQLFGVFNLLLKGGGADELAELGRRIREFSSTKLAVSLFGDGEVATTQGILTKLTKIAEVARDIGSRIRAFVQTFVDFLSGDLSLQEFVSVLFRKFITGFKMLTKPIIQLAFNIGRDLLQGLIDGVINKFDEVAFKFIDLFNELINKIKDFLGIASPSRLMFDIGQSVGQGFQEGVENSPARKIIGFFKKIFKILAPIIKDMVDSWKNWLLGFVAIQGVLFAISKSSLIAGAVSTFISLAGAVAAVVAAFLAMRFVILTVGAVIRSLLEGDFGALGKQMQRFVGEFQLVSDIIRKIGFGGIANALDALIQQLNTFFSAEGSFETLLNNLFGFGAGDGGGGSKVVRALVNFFTDVFSAALQVFEDVWLLARGKIVFRDMIANLVSGFSDISGIKFTLTDLERALQQFVDFVKDNFLTVVGVVALVVNALFSATIIRLFATFSVQIARGIRLFATFRTTAQALLSALRILAIQLIVLPVFFYGLQGSLEGLFSALGGVLTLIKGLASGDFEQIVQGLAGILEGLFSGVVGFVKNISDLLERGLRLAGLDSFADKVGRVKDILEALLDPRVRARIREVLELGLAEGIKAVAVVIATLINNFNKSPIAPIIRGIIGAFIDLGKVLFEVGKFIIGILPEIASAIGGLIDKFMEFLKTDTGQGLVRLVISPLELLVAMFKRLTKDGVQFVALLFKFKEALLAVGAIALIKSIPALFASFSVGGGGLAVFLTQFATFGILLAGGILLIYGFIGSLKGLVFALSGVGDMLHGFSQILSGDVSEGLRTVVEGLAKIGVGILAALAGFVLNIGELAAKAAEALGKALGIEWLETLGARALAAIESIKPYLSFDVLEGVAQGIADRALEAIRVIGEFIKAVKENFNLNTLKVVGEALINGLWDGMIFLMIKLPQKIVAAIWDHLVRPFLEALGIASPSTLFMQYGDDIIAGLILGIETALSLLGAAVTGLINFLKDQFTFDNLINAMAVGLKIARAIADAFDWAVDQFFNIVDSLELGGLIQGAVDGLFDFLDDLPSPTAIIDVIENIFGSIVDAVKNIDLSIFTDAVGLVEEGFNKVKGFLGFGSDDNGGGGQTSVVSTMLASLNNVTLDASTRDSVMRLGENLIIAVTSGMGSDASKAAISAVGLTMSGLFIEGVKKGFQLTGLVALIGQVWALAILKGFVTSGVVMAIGSTTLQFTNTFKDRVEDFFKIQSGISGMGMSWGMAMTRGIAHGMTTAAGAIFSALGQLMVAAAPFVMQLIGLFTGAMPVIIGVALGVSSAVNNMASSFNNATNSMNSAWAAANNLRTALQNLSNIQINVPSMPSISSFTPQQQNISSAISSGISSAVQYTGKYNFNPNYKVPTFDKGGWPKVGQWSSINEGGISEVFRTKTGTYMLPGRSGLIEPIRNGAQVPSKGGAGGGYVDNSQNYYTVQVGDLAGYSRTEVEELFKRAHQEVNKTGSSQSMMDVKRQLLLQGRR